MKYHQKLSLIVLLLLLAASCSAQSKSSLERRITRIESGLLAESSDPFWKRMDLDERMAHYDVPGVSIVLINDYRIEWAKAYGVMEAGSDQPVTTTTIFQTASTAKPVVAAAALHLVEAGLLDLDQNVNDYLLSWTLPENGLSEEIPVTLRLLLSHNAGLDYIPLLGYAQGEPLPDRAQILNGTAPAISDPVEVLAPPGALYSYSNGGYLVVEELLVDVTGKPFDQVLAEVILDPLDLADIIISCPLPAARIPSAASGHLEDGSVLPGKWNNFPEMGPGGSWWATPSDLARFHIELMRAYTGKSETILSQEMAIEMLTAQVEDRGLGPWVGDDGRDRFYYGHPGHNTGYKNYTVFYPDRGQGLVIMTNSENGDLLYREILNSVNHEYGWLRDNTVLYVVVAVLLIIGVGGSYLLNRRTKQVDEDIQA